ncbi:MAG: type II secretion system F family protein [Geminicoccaceae bacterium]
MAALSMGGIAYVILYPFMSGEAKANKRMAKVSTGAKGRDGRAAARLESEGKDQRRKQMQKTLKEMEENQKRKKKKVTLAMSLAHAGLQISVGMFWIMSVVCGMLVGFMVLLSGSSWQLSLGAAFAACLGLPRWILKHLKKRRIAKFLDEFANAIDVIVRGIKAGLPVNDTLKVISQESPDPVGPEFKEIVEGQKLGVPLDQGLERMYERMPLAEVNFLAIVVSIQSRTGGNLAEALGNLSKVLRERKKMQSKVRAVSQEAKSSAAIIGALPPSIMGLVYLVNPEYISLLWTTQAGQFMLLGSAIWMGMGVLVMRKMINFDF